METIAININELKQVIHDTFVDVLSSRRDLIGDAVIEAIEDIGLAKAIEDGQTGEYINLEDFKKSLHKKINISK